MWIETNHTGRIEYFKKVTSLAEVWIETPLELYVVFAATVTSLAEVWIETLKRIAVRKMKWSLPLRKCGLKLADY